MRLVLLYGLKLSKSPWREVKTEVGLNIRLYGTGTWTWQERLQSGKSEP